MIVKRKRIIWRKASEEEINQNLDNPENPGMIIEHEEEYEINIEDSEQNNNLKPTDV